MSAVKSHIPGCSAHGERSGQGAIVGRQLGHIVGIHTRRPNAGAVEDHRHWVSYQEEGRCSVRRIPAQDGHLVGVIFQLARAGLARTVAAIAIVAATKNRFMHVPPLSSRPLFHGLPPITRIAGNNCNAWRNNFSWARGASEQVTVELIVWKAPSRCASLSDQLGRALARAIAKSLSLRRCHQVADRECSAICPVMVSPIGSRQMRRTIVPFSRPWHTNWPLVGET